MSTDNASDSGKIRDARKRDAAKAAQQKDDLIKILEKDFGRRFVWRMLCECKVFESIWSPSALIHYNSGRQDVGHWLLAQVNDAQLDAILIMMTEHAKEKLNEDKK